MATCTYSVPDKDASGDNYYGGLICRQDLSDYFWATYGFNGQSEYWDDGFGYENFCDTNKALGRTYNSLYLLTYSAPDYGNDEYDSPILNWGRRYVREHIDRLRSFCGDGKAYARNTGSQNVELYLPMWYEQSVPERASTFVHEARHTDKSHNANFPAGSIFGAGDSGADSNWDYQGAWMYEVLYLWWFAYEGERTTTAMKDRAAQMGNLYIDNAFATRPPYVI